jgi:peptidoglycan/LPS O-acetylase OafA/YrhL
MNDISRIRHLDVWRFIAVSMVIFGHLISVSTFSYLATIVPGASLLQRFANFGVLIFFFISGFVICRKFIEEWQDKSFVSLKAFYLRRSFRNTATVMAIFGNISRIGLSWHH